MIFGNPDFQPVRLQVVLGSDLEICPKDIFRSGASSGAGIFAGIGAISSGCHRDGGGGRLGGERFCPKGIFAHFGQEVGDGARSTVVLVMSNNLAIALLLMPSLCFSRIAASRFSFSCTERAGETSGLGFLPQGHFSQGGFRLSS